jgi:hypothetical protein
MAQEKPGSWRCNHHYPIVVDRALGGRRAKCLGCGSSGPTRAEAEQAMLALRAEARYARRLGA